jgi:putative FmdB family regulatory protein
MPIYAYRCQDCGHAVEVLQKISDAPLTECPACRRPGLVKQVTAAGFQLKGSGWYATDFKDNGTKPKVAKGEGAPASTEAKPDGSKTTESPPGGAKTPEAAPAAAPTPSAAPTPAAGPSPAPS